MTSSGNSLRANALPVEVETGDLGRVQRHIVHMSRNGVRKTKAKLEQDLARDVRNYKKGFHKDIGQKTKGQGECSPCDKQEG